MKLTRLAFILATGTSVIGFAAAGNAQIINATDSSNTNVPAVTTGQSPGNPGATAIERANNPFNNDAYESMGMRQDRFSAAQDAPSGFASGQRTAPVQSNITASNASVAKVLDVQMTISVIQATDYNYRSEIKPYVISHVAGGDVALDMIVQQGSDRLTGETRAQAIHQTQRNRRELIATLNNASLAAPADWNQARSEVANSYQRYAASVIHVENVANGVARTSINAPGVLIVSAR